MLFRPGDNVRMWDTTLYEENGVFHLFYLAGGNIGHAVTSDFMDFQECPQINCIGKQGAWNEHGVPLTGCVVKTSENYKMLLGTKHPVTEAQVYGLYESEDLYTWQEYKSNPVLCADGVYYGNTVLERDWYMFSAWRDPQMYEYKNGWYYICMCARTPAFDHSTTGALVANMRTQDFKYFEFLSPIDNVGDKVKYAECPDCFTIDNNKYITFLDHGWGGLRIHTSTREDSSGTYYKKFNAEKQCFEWLPDSLLIGTANDRQGAWAARTCQVGNQRLLYHHTTATKPAFAFPKVVQVRKNGELYLAYFETMNKLLGDVIKLKSDAVQGDLGLWTHKKSNYLGKCHAWGSAVTLVTKISDICVQTTINMKFGARAGVVLRCSEKDEYTSGMAVFLDFERNAIQMEELAYRYAEGYGHSHSDIVRGGVIRDVDSKKINLEYGKNYSLKIFARSEFFEVYLNNEWVMTKAFEKMNKFGSLQLMLERGEAEFVVTANQLIGSLNE